MKEKQISNIMEIPSDILVIIKKFLGNKVYIFLYVISSSRNNYKKSVNDIYNSITYVMLFNKILWGGFNIPSQKEFNSCLSLDPSEKISNKQRLKSNFKILNEISEYLFESPNNSRKDIIWKGEKIKKKIRYSKFISPNTFWTKKLYEIKFGGYQICGCTPYCWRCRKKCNYFDIKLYDKLLTKNVNGNYYRCIVNYIFLNKKDCRIQYKSVRSIYIEYNSIEHLKNNIYAIVEFLPYPHENSPKKLIQTVNICDFYYVSDCYSYLESWGPKNKNIRFILDKVYNIPLGWKLIGKKDARNALALIY